MKKLFGMLLAIASLGLSTAHANTVQITDGSQIIVTPDLELTGTIDLIPGDIFSFEAIFPCPRADGCFLDLEITLGTDATDPVGFAVTSAPDFGGQFFDDGVIAPGDTENVYAGGGDNSTPENPASVFFNFYMDGPANQEAIPLPFTQVSSVPVPAAVWLFGSAIIGLVGIRRKS